MIVLDASAGLAALYGPGPARTASLLEPLHAPHLVDSELLQVLRRDVRRGRIPAIAGSALLGRWRSLGVTRHPVVDLLDRIWALRENLTAYDAGYVALAERLGCALVTADARLARAPGIRCPVTVVPG